MAHHATHATFTLERFYPVPAARVFAAWADPAAKAHWFAPEPDSAHELDFRVGGREVARGSHDGGPVMTFESIYQDIVPEARIVYTSTMSTTDTLMTVSLTTVQFRPTHDETAHDETARDGTRLLLTEQGTFLDGHEEPRWREQGTADQLTALARVLGTGDHG
jgi:uncharacterized protein YndB with AHSA1/START domain